MPVTEDKIIKFVKSLYAGRDSMHNFEHIQRLRKRVDLYKTFCSNIDEDKLIFLVYFHGLIPYVRAHEREILGMGFPADWIEALDRHLINPLSIEEKLVSDANSWEVVGEFGIQKSLQVGKERGQSIDETFSIMKGNVKRVVFHTEIGKKFGEPGIRIIEKSLEENMTKEDSSTD